MFIDFFHFFLRCIRVFYTFSMPLRARASFNFDKACKWRRCILCCKNQGKINIFRFLRFLYFCLRNWFPWIFLVCFDCKMFHFLEGAICLFCIHFCCHFEWFWLQFGFQSPPGRLPGGIQKKHPNLIPIFCDFEAAWGPQNQAKIGKNLLRKRFFKWISFLC